MKKLECFVDTSAFVALYHSSDQLHQDAIRISEQLDGYTFFISDAILTETFTILRYRIGFDAAHHFLETSLHDEHFKLVPIDQKVRQQTIKLLSSFSDHKISFCDALTVELMKALRIHDIFTFDKHFEMMGMSRIYR